MFTFKIPMNLAISLLDDAQKKHFETEKVQLDWKNSVVDLLKLLGVDSSLENRQRIFRELDGPFHLWNSLTQDDYRGMNEWLHAQIFLRINFTQ